MQAVAHQIVRLADPIQLQPFADAIARLSVSPAFGQEVAAPVVLPQAGHEVLIWHPPMISRWGWLPPATS